MFVSCTVLSVWPSIRGHSMLCASGRAGSCVVTCSCFIDTYNSYKEEALTYVVRLVRYLSNVRQC